MPVSMLLKSASGADYRQVVAGFGGELQADRKILIGKAARYRKCRQAAKIADTPEGIGED